MQAVCQCAVPQHQQPHHLQAAAHEEPAAGGGGPGKPSQAAPQRAAVGPAAGGQWPGPTRRPDGAAGHTQQPGPLQCVATGICSASKLGTGMPVTKMQLLGTFFIVLLLLARANDINKLN